MICEECKKEGLESRVYTGMCSKLMAYYEPFYDENGQYHLHDANVKTQHYYCSNEHEWREKSMKSCPTCGDWWK